jgi:hypothetical protein
MPLGKYCRNSPLVFHCFHAAMDCRIAKVNVDIGGQGKAFMVGHLFATIPGERLMLLAGVLLFL